MNLRTTGILLLLNVLLALGLVLTRDRGGDGGRVKLLPESVDISGTDVITFSAARGVPAFSLHKGPKGRWHLGAPDGPLANQVAAVSILADLMRAPVLPFEVKAGADHGLEPPVRTLTLSTKGQEIVGIEFGHTHPLNVGTFARVKGDAEVRLTLIDLGSMIGRRPGHYRELRVFPFSPLEIRRLEVERTRKDGSASRIAADRKWLTWFLESPRRLRGDSRAFEGMVSGLLGIRRTAIQPRPQQQPNVRVSVLTETDRVDLDIWVFHESAWLGCVRGEQDAISLDRLSVRPLIADFGQLWDRALFQDSAHRATAVEWKLGSAESVVVEQDPVRPDGWLMRKPRDVPADTDACRAFIQQLVQMKADGLVEAGITDEAAGLAPPWGRIRVRFAGGAGEQELLVGTPLSDGHRVRFARDTENIFRLTEKKLRVLSPSPLGLVDRTIYRGTWQQVSQVEIKRGASERFLFENVGQEEKRHWRCTDTSTTPRKPAESYVAGTPMRNLIVHLTERLRGDAVLAWSQAGAPPAWGVRHPRYVIAFADTRRGATRQIRIAVGRPQEDRNGETWYPVWREGPGLSEHSFVYRIDRELVRRIRAVMPD